MQGHDEEDSLLQEEGGGPSDVGGGHGGACHLHIQSSQPQVQNLNSWRHHLQHAS